MSKLKKFSMRYKFFFAMLAINLILLFEASALGTKFTLTRLVLDIGGIAIIAFVTEKLLSETEKEKIFTFLFRNHTTNIHKADLEKRATTIADTISSYINNGQNHGMMGGYGAYLRFIGDIAGTDVWIVDEDLNLITSGMGHAMMSMEYAYKDLPINAEQLVGEVFTGKTAFSEDFSSMLTEATLTVGVPIQNNGEIFGVVLLHSPINGTNTAMTQGFILLIISMVIALIISFFLSAGLSYSFTRPLNKMKDTATALAKGNYSAKNDISQNDEIGELAKTIDVFANQLDIASKKSEKLEQMRKDFIANISHELLLDLSKLQNTDFIMKKEEISICDVIEDVARSTERLADSKNIKINLRSVEIGCQIYGDYGRLRQMLSIVLDNAVKFSPENSSIEIILKDKQIHIKDTGCGITKEHLPYIFDKFYMSRSEQNKIGSGLGLAIAKQIADRHGILLTVESNERKGTVFTFKMP